MLLIDTIVSVSSIINPVRSKQARKRETLSKSLESHTFKINIYQTKKLSKKRGRTPEQMIAKHYAQALDDAGFGYEIQYGYEKEYRPIEERPGSSIPAVRWWKDNMPDNGDTKNILLMDARGGGRGDDINNAATVGVNRINKVGPLKQKGSSAVYRNIWAAIHEMGHTLGGKHHTPMMEDVPKNHPRFSMYFSQNMKDMLDERYKAKAK